DDRGDHDPGGVAVRGNPVPAGLGSRSGTRVTRRGQPLARRGTPCALARGLLTRRSCSGADVSTADHRRTAVIGMAVRLPGADSPEAFWDNNEAGRVFVRRFAPAELVAAGYPESYARDPEVIGASALVDDIDLFDAACFGMSPRD